jgi:hypothetical protein
MVERNVDDIALVSKGRSAQSETDLVQIGAQVIAVATHDPQQISAACEGAECAVSALTALRAALIDA